MIATPQPALLRAQSELRALSRCQSWRRRQQPPALVHAYCGALGSNLAFTAEENKTKEVVLEAVTLSGTALRWAPSHQSDRAIVMAAVRSCGAALAFASKPLKHDMAIVIAALESDGTALYFVPAELKLNLEVQVRALAQHKDAIYYVRSRDSIVEHIRTSLGTHLTMVLLRVYPRKFKSSGRRVATGTRFGQAAMMNIAQYAGAPSLAMVGPLRTARANLL